MVRYLCQYNWITLTCDTNLRNCTVMNNVRYVLIIEADVLGTCRILSFLAI